MVALLNAFTVKNFDHQRKRAPSSMLRLCDSQDRICTRTIGTLFCIYISHRVCTTVALKKIAILWVHNDYCIPCIGAVNLVQVTSYTQAVSWHHYPLSSPKPLFRTIILPKTSPLHVHLKNHSIFGGSLNAYLEPKDDPCSLSMPWVNSSCRVFAEILWTMLCTWRQTAHRPHTVRNSCSLLVNFCCQK